MVCVGAVEVRSSMNQPKTFQLACLVCLGALCCVTLGACPADKSSMTDEAAGYDAGISCVDDPLAETYMPDMQKTGSLGKLKFQLVQSEPGPPIKGNNTWTVKVTDLAGNELKDAAVVAKPFMPYHGHGSSAKPKTTTLGDGYELKPLYLYMRGVWQVTITAKTATQADSAVFSFCIS